MRLSVSMILLPSEFVLELAHRKVGRRVTRTNAFQIMFRVMVDDVDIEVLTLGAQKILRICFTPSVGSLGARLLGSTLHQELYLNHTNLHR